MNIRNMFSIEEMQNGRAARCCKDKLSQIFDGDALRQRSKPYHSKPIKAKTLRKLTWHQLGVLLEAWTDA